MHVRTTSLKLSAITDKSGKPRVLDSGRQRVALRGGYPLSNQDTIRMVKAKFDDPTILKAIETRRSAFDLPALQDFVNEYN